MPIPMKCISLIVLAAVGASFSAAQTTNASIVGTVRDSSGAVVPGLKVTATNEGTREQFGQETNELGSYTFTVLRPGAYTIHAERQGFRPVDVRGILLQVNQTARIDVTVEVGQTSDVIEVKASAPVLATDTTDVGQVIRTRKSPGCR